MCITYNNYAKSVSIFNKVLENVRSDFMLELAQTSKDYVRYNDGKALLVADINVFDYKNKYLGKVEIDIVCDSYVYQNSNLELLKEAIEENFTLIDIIKLFGKDIFQIWTQSRVKYSEMNRRGNYQDSLLHNVPVIYKDSVKNYQLLPLWAYYEKTI